MISARSANQPHRSHIRWTLAASLVLLVAAILRLLNITSLPQGFHYDEAVNFAVSQQIAFEGARPFPVYAAFNGREVLYYYVNALAMLGLGTHIFTMRAVSAALNLIAVAATIGLGRAAFGGRRGWLLGLLAAGLMAVSFPQIFLARQAFRAVSQPTLQALTLWALFMGLRHAQPRRALIWLAASGVLAGLSLYTYMASRLFPLWVGLIVLAVWWFDREQRRTRFWQGAWLALFMLLTALPITRYYIQHPDVFNDRLQQLNTGEASVTYTESVTLHLKLFFLEGDPLLRYNQPSQPYFPLLIGLLGVLGLGISLQRLLTGRDPVRRAAYGLLVLSPLMVIPSVLAVDGLPPSHMRSVGMVPAIFFLPALGITTLWAALLSRLDSWQPYQLRLASLAGGLGLAALAVMVGGRYHDWASTPVLYYQADGDMIAAGRWLEDHTDTTTLVYVTAQHYDHPSLLIHDVPGDTITFLLDRRVFWPPAGRDATLVETASTPLPDSLRPWLGNFEVQHVLTNAQGAVAATIYRWADAPNPPRVGFPTPETVGGWLRLADKHLPRATSGQSVTVTSLWAIQATPPYPDLRPIFEVRSPAGDLIARADPFTQHSNRWRHDESLVQQAVLDIPPGTPPGTYPVRVTWVSAQADRYVGRTSTDGAFNGLWTDLGELNVQRPEAFPPPAALSIDLSQARTVQDGLRLLGWNLGQANYLPGQRVDLTLYWQATRAGLPNVPLRITARPSEQALFSGAPVMDTYPTGQWATGELVTDRHRWRWPPDMPPGNYDLYLDVAGTEINLGTAEIAALARQFNLPPEVAHPLDLVLGDQVALRGYDLAPEQLTPGQTLELTLYWQLLAETDLPLTVFLHLVGPEGDIPAQRDVQPRDNTYPVALWLPGEVVADTHQLRIPPDAPPGRYTLRAGLYLQENGQRLRVIDRAGTGTTGADYIDLTTITVE